MREIPSPWGDTSPLRDRVPEQVAVPIAGEGLWEGDPPPDLPATSQDHDIGRPQSEAPERASLEQRQLRNDALVQEEWLDGDPLPVVSPDERRVHPRPKAAPTRHPAADHAVSAPDATVQAESPRSPGFETNPGSRQRSARDVGVSGKRPRVNRIRRPAVVAANGMPSLRSWDMPVASSNVNQVTRVGHPTATELSAGLNFLKGLERVQGVGF